YRVDAETLSNRGQGRLVHERGAGAAQIALLVVRPELVQALRDREVQERVAEVLEALVVQARRATVRQRHVEERGIGEAVVELPLGPGGARAHLVISTCLSKTTTSHKLPMYGALPSCWICTEKPLRD